MLDLKVLKSIVEGKAIYADSSGDGDSEFNCPRCGSSHFGSYRPDTLDPVYHCHDEFNCGCSWSGPASKCFIYTYSKQTLAQELLSLYQNK